MFKNLKLGLVNLKYLAALAISLVVLSSLAACSPLESAGTEGPKVTISNPTAIRAADTDLPVVKVDYAVKFPSDLYAQTLDITPVLTCALHQVQLTKNPRSLSGQPVAITGFSAAVQKGVVTINVTEADKFIGGNFTIVCSLSAGKTLGISNPLSVEVPKPKDPGTGCSVDKESQNFRSIQSVNTLAEGCPGTGSGSTKYAVFLLTENSGGTIYIGQEATLKKLRGCDTPYGGRCDDPNKVYPPVKYVKESADFDTYEQAEAAACKAGKLEPGYWGTKLAAYGGHYWFDGSCKA